MFWLVIFLFIGSLAQDFEGLDITAPETTQNPPELQTSAPTTTTTVTPIVLPTVTPIHPTLIGAVPGLFINHSEPKIRTTTVLPVSELMKKKAGAKLVSQDVTRPPGWKPKPGKESQEGQKGVPKPKQTFKDSVGDELESNPNGDYLEEIRIDLEYIFQTGDITEEPTSFTTVPTTTESTTTSTTTVTTTTTTVIPTTTETVPTTTTTVPREFQPGLVNEVEFLPGDAEPNQTNKSSRKSVLIDAEVNSISRSRKRPQTTNNSEEFGKEFKKLGGRRIIYKKRTLVVHDVGVEDVRSLPPPPPGAFIIHLKKSVSIPARRIKRDTNTALVNSVSNKKDLETLGSTVTPANQPINNLIKRTDVIKQEMSSRSNEAGLDNLGNPGSKPIVSHSRSDFRRMMHDQPTGAAPYTPSQNPGQVQVSPYNPWQEANGRQWVATQQQNYWGNAPPNQQSQPGRPAQTASLQQPGAEYWNQQGFQPATPGRPGNAQLSWPAVAPQYRPPALPVQQPIIPPQPVLLLQTNPLPVPQPITTVTLLASGPQNLLVPATNPNGQISQGRAEIPGVPCDEGCKMERHNRRRINSEGESPDKLRIQNKHEVGAIDSATSPELLRKGAKELRPQLHVKLPTSMAPLLELSEYPDTQYDDETDRHPVTVKPLEMERDRFRFETARRTYEIQEEERAEFVPVGKSSITLDQLVNFAMDAVDSKIRSHRKEKNPGDIAIEAANSESDYDYKTEETVNVPTSIVRTNRRSGTPYFKSAQNLMSSVYDQVNLVHYNPNSYEFETGVPVLRDESVQNTSVRPITLYSKSRKNSLLKNIQLP